ncbi:hypothetical protein [Pseudomonas luteola]|uniref:hypothetical protein n=1 Tax=Pseudomonas luteola TaxID=47886 RepID=UPI00142EAB38|nr:hypothetical protein [Pseudomonas luteola]
MPDAIKVKTIDVSIRINGKEYDNTYYCCYGREVSLEEALEDMAQEINDDIESASKS